MNLSLFKIEFVKLRLFLVAAAVVVGYVLFKPDPLKLLDYKACLLGFIGSGLLGCLLYNDFGGVEVFMFSRSFSRNSLFWHRWFIGVGIQIALLGVIAVLIAAGVRGWINSKNPFQPMIKFYELKILWSISFGMFAGYAMSVFFTLRRRIVNAERPCNIFGRIGRWLSYAAPVPAVGIFFVFGTDLSSYDSPGSMLMYAWGYVLAINVVAVLASRQCFVKMEIKG